MIAGNPLPRGGLLFGRFPNQEPGGGGSPSKHLVQLLRGGFSSSGFLVTIWDPAPQIPAIMVSFFLSFFGLEDPSQSQD